MKQITVSAPGKLMLLGEHAVVYNHPCLVTAVGQRMKATIEKIDISELHIEAPDVNVTDYKKLITDVGSGDIPKGAKFVEIAVKNFKEKHPFLGGIKVTTSSEFSSLFGFGSSSASTVCVIKALSELFDIKLDEKGIFDLAYKTVLDIQGKGSGFDIAAAVYGGTLYYLTGGKKIEKLPIKSLSLIVGYSGIKADTATLVNKVAAKAKEYPEVIDTIYNKIEELVEKTKEYLLAEDWGHLGELMNVNQEYLEKLDVSIPKLDEMIKAARDAGAFGAKLSGAGGGDCMIAIASPETKKSIEKAIEKAGGQIIQINTNVEGVRVEI